VNVQVEDSLRTVLTIVDHQAKSIGALFLTDFLCDVKHVAQKGSLILSSQSTRKKRSRGSTI